MPTSRQLEILEEFKKLRETHKEVTFLGEGKKERNGELTNENAIIIGVDKKIKITEDSERKLLPKELLGRQTDVHEINDTPTSTYNVDNSMVKDYFDGPKWIGGSIGPVIHHKKEGLVALTNRHVAIHNTSEDGMWSYDDRKGNVVEEACQTLDIAQKDVDAAILKVLKPELFELTSNIVYDVVAPSIGTRVFYKGGNSQKMCEGNILHIGWGSIHDNTQPDNLYYTLNFRFVNLQGGDATPINGDSGSAVYTNMKTTDGKDSFFCVGMIYGGGGRTDFAAAVPILEVLNHYPDLEFRKVKVNPQDYIIEELEKTVEEQEQSIKAQADKLKNQQYAAIRMVRYMSKHAPKELYNITKQARSFANKNK